MATDYDASRKSEEEQKEESLETLQLASGEDKDSGKVDVDEAEAAETFELPGADLSNEELIVEVIPKQHDEFTCTNCFLVHHHSMRPTVGVDVCRDCA